MAIENIADELDQRALVIEAAENFRSILIASATMLRKTNPRAAGALYVLERDVYSAVSHELLLEGWPEPKELASVPRPQKAAKARGCRHKFDEAGKCSKCGEARRRRRKGAQEATASGA